MQYEKPDANIIKVWRITRFIRLLVFLLILLGASLVYLYANDSLPTFILLIVLSLFSLYNLITLLVYPQIEYKQWQYFISEDRVFIEHGIFNITETIIPIVRIQHISITRGVISRKYGLCQLSIHTASGNFLIKGLSESTSKNLSELLHHKLEIKLSEYTEGGES